MGALLTLLDRLYNLRDRTSFFKDDTLNVILLVKAIWRGRLGIILTTILAMAGILVLSYQITPLYPSKSTVYLISKDEAGGGLPASLGAMASVLGYGMPGSGNQPLALDELLDSRRLFEQLAEMPMQVPGTPGATRPLREIWFPSGEKSEAYSRERTIRRLRSTIRIGSGMETNLIDITVLADSPELARTLNRELVEMADTYYRVIRTEELSTKHTFLQNQTQEFQTKLQEAENTLTEFLIKNAQYEQSPALLQEYARLMRQIELKQKIYLELQAQYFSTGLELSGQPRHVRLLNEPTTPLKTTYPDRFKLVLFSLVAALLLNILAIILLNEMGPSRNTPNSNNP